MSKRQVKFSFASVEEKAVFSRYARERGMSLSALASLATHQYIAKYPPKGKGIATRQDCTVCANYRGVADG